ncbi:hypothetical protein XA68_10364 [Ophiocordyceps unilateralis]|uniref:MJ1316 RNA cyclic group end recognition domain-containing protein n=1 Tax=Ophiocordyceps unilateralis TaxID=268505 RepID=A0A2A9P2S8_OPHUN|nr:hypothetical protein XA68_10364 [Ophiocordyceps unilateralis]
MSPIREGGKRRGAPLCYLTDLLFSPRERRKTVSIFTRTSLFPSQRAKPPPSAFMANARTKKLNELGLKYPFWIFDVDQSSWPRKLDDVLPGSRPAMITGWYKWPWEYGTDLRRVNDPLPAGVEDASKDGAKVPGAVHALLEQLRYDDRFDPDTFRVVYEHGGDAGRNSKDFCDWVFDSKAGEYVAPPRIVRVERKWDSVPVWDRETGENLFQSTSQANMAYGVASLVHNDAELVRAAGVKASDDGSSIRKAEFELLDDGGLQVKGVVYPNRFHRERGLSLQEGPDSDWNRAILVGTALEKAPWSEVEGYCLDKRDGPLL